MYNSVVSDCRLAGIGPVLDTVSCEDPHNTMCSVLHAVDSPSDEIACMLVLLTRAKPRCRPCHGCDRWSCRLRFILVLVVQAFLEDVPRCVVCP